MKSLTLVFLLIAVLEGALSKIVKTDTEKIYTTDIHFLTKFAVRKDPEDGLARIYLDFTTTQQGQHILLFEGIEDYRDIVENPDLSCAEKRSLANMSFSINEQYEPDTFGLSTAVSIYDDVSSEWFFVADACGLEMIQFKRFRLQFNQGNNSEFSAEDFGLITIFLVFLIFISLVTLLHVYSQYVIYSTSFYNILYGMITFSTILQFLNLMFYYVSYEAYRRNGYGIPGLFITGNFIEVLAQCSLLILIFLIGQGYKISQETITRPISLAIFSLIYVSLYLYYAIESSSTVELPSFRTEYQRVSGILLVSSRFIMAAYFIYCIRRTFLDEVMDIKKDFYRKTGIIFTIWLTTLPIIILLGLTERDILYKKQTYAATCMYNVIGVVAMVIQLWPSKTHTLFSKKHSINTSSAYGGIE